MENKASIKNKTGSNAIVTHSDTKRDVPGGLSFTITLLWQYPQTAMSCKRKWQSKDRNKMNVELEM
jgi:hypothetical protein